MGLCDRSDMKFHGESDIALQNDIGPFGGGDIKAQRYTDSVFCMGIELLLIHIIHIKHSFSIYT